MDQNLIKMSDLPNLNLAKTNMNLVRVITHLHLPEEETFERNGKASNNLVIFTTTAENMAILKIEN